MIGRERRRAMDCETVADLVPELALGLLDGAERAAMLGHVEGCSRCQADLAGLTEVGEHLLLLAPAAEPPPGFESRVLAQLAPSPRTRVRWRPLWVAAAAVLVVLASAGAVLALTRSDGDGDGGDVRAGAGSSTTTTGADSVLATVDMMNDDGEVVAAASYHRGTAGEPGMLAVDMADWVAELQDRGIPADAEWWLVVVDTFGDPYRYALPIAPTAEVRLVDGPQAVAIATATITTGDGRPLCQGTFRPDG